MSNVVNKDTFVVFKDKEGVYHKDKPDGEYQEVKITIKKPDYSTRQKAENFYSQKFREYVESGCFIHDELKRVLAERKLWSEDDEKKFSEIVTKIAANEVILRKGGIRLSEMKRLAVENLKLRTELTTLLVNYNATEQMTAEFKAQQSQFNWLVAHCTLDEKGNQFFKGFEDYCKQDESGNPVVNLAGSSLFKLMSGNNEDYRKDWPEFKLLHKHGLIDDKFRYTKNGQFVDENGKPVNEKGQWVNDKGEPIDSDGKVIDQTPLGNMEDAVFLDD